MYALKDGRVQGHFFHLFWNRNFPVPPLNEAQFLQLVFYNSQAEVHLPYEMNVPPAFEADLYFHALASISKEIESKKLNIVWNAMISFKACIAVQLVRMAWNVLPRYCLLVSLRVIIQPYLWFNPLVPKYQVLSH